MATVFLAHDQRHDRQVALKVLHPELAASLGPERFQREVKLAARLQHPHVLTVFDSGEAAGYLWFTMPFVEGESLRDRLTRETQLPVDEAVRIAIEAARGLEYAHQHGVIHRDIKPENILLTRDGSTLVADFGIARALSGSEGQSLTETGLAVGTPQYMSPEQASGERTLDPRTDIYALGTLLYEMLAGEPPFTGPTAQAVIAKRMRGEVPDIRAARPSVPRAIGEAVSKALAPTPADRYATAAEFAKALAATMTASLTGARPSVPSARATGEAPAAKRPIPAGFALLLLGFLIGAGVLFAFRRGGAAPATAAPKVIAVLPFENQGDSAQEYFADGITDEIRGKLSALPGLEVIASGSMRGYKHSDKPLDQIAGELGADYLLLARVRWARNPDGSAQVQVSPELVAIAAGKPVTKWQQAFDAALTNVFEVQAQIAAKVAGALDVALADSVSRQLAERPTANLPAYDAYLRGTQLTITEGRNDLPSLRQASAHFRQALALDSSFAAAWAQLSRAQSLLYSNGVPDPAVDSAARRAAERSVALAPDEAVTHQALGAYYNNVRGDIPAARREFETAVRLAPNSALTLRSMALVLHAAGQYDSALAYARQAAQLDPRFQAGFVRLGWVLRAMRRYPEARVALDRAVALAPNNLGTLEHRVLVELGAGDLDSARALLRSAPATIDRSTLLAYVGSYWDLFWVLDDTQQRMLLTLTPAEFDGDRAAWGIVLAQTHWIRGNQALARAYGDSARAAFTAHVQAAPDDAQQRLFLGLAKAYMGRNAEAMQDGERGVAMAAQRPDASTDPYFRQVLARLYVVCGEYGKAIDQLERLLAMPSDLSPGWLRIDPNFAPLKGNPRFEALLRK